MEFIIGLIVIIVICKILGVSNFVLILCGLGLIELTIIAMMLFFVYYTFHLLFTKKKQASFTKIDISDTNKVKFQTAYYMVDDEEYPCVFPREMGISSKLYKTDKTYNVRFSKLLKKVYDKWAVITCIVGLFFSTSAVAITFEFIKEMGFFL